MMKLFTKLGLLCLMCLVSSFALAQDYVTATWDWQNDYPEGINSATSIQGNVGYVASDVEEIELYVDATNGKLQGRTTDAQFNSGTILRVPVQSSNDVVIITNYSGYHNYTVAGVGATDDTTTYTAKSSDVNQGYVEIIATDDNYLYSIQVTQYYTKILEKQLYNTSWTEWPTIDRKSANGVTNTIKTKYSHEEVTFSFTGVGVDPAGTNDRFSDELGYMITAKYTDEYAAELPYALTTSIQNLTRIELRQCATGSSRGIKVSVMGDEDSGNWAVLHNETIGTAAGEDLSINVNRTNCLIKFEAYDGGPNQNAYVTELRLYGMVDMSLTPALGTFTVNGVEYVAGDIFDEDSSGNMVATVEISKTEDMISATNPLQNVLADNGTIGDITYSLSSDGSGIVTIPITVDDQTLNYVLTVAYKPDYTVSYIDTNGSVIATQSIEKDAIIGEFIVDESQVTVEDGYKFRGWFVEAKQGTRKYTTEEVITDNTDLYALATEIETANGSSRYKFDLTNKYFYAEDHEAFDPTNGAYHDAQHGWEIAADGTIDILVGPHAYILFTLCQYGNGCNLTLYDVDGSEYATITGRSSTDGGSESIEYIGEGGTLTIKTDGLYYLHGLTIANVADNPIETNEQGYYVVAQGNAGHLLTTLEIVNATASSSSRTYVFIPDGTYDLGNECLTAISGNNISIIGQSMDNTIIVNTPEEEGIGVTATFLITGNNTYLQDLTLQNAYPYYTAGGSAGRAVCIQDKGNHTICKNVRMLSYQDTYYSNPSNSSAELYWETSDIHGTVDFLCGEGAVYYNQCTITVEPRNADGSGSCTITAPSTVKGQHGYIFESCTINNLAASFNYGRTWNNNPECVYLNTTILNESGLIANRWTLEGMGIPAERFYEYNTMNSAGTRISPDTFSPVFIKSGYADSQYETILTDEQAAEYALDKIFTSWTPAEYTVQTEMGSLTLEDNTLSWQEPENSLGVYAIFHNDEFVDMVSGTSYVVTESGDYTVRAANEYGGFGSVSETATGITSKVVDGKVVRTAYYNLQGARVGQSYKGIVIKVDTLEDGSQVARKIIAK